MEERSRTGLDPLLSLIQYESTIDAWRDHSDDSPHAGLLVVAFGCPPSVSCFTPEHQDLNINQGCSLCVEHTACRHQRSSSSTVLLCCFDFNILYFTFHLCFRFLSYLSLYLLFSTVTTCCCSLYRSPVCFLGWRIRRWESVTFEAWRLSLRLSSV